MLLVCHGLSRVAEEIRDRFPDVDQLIAQTKKVFLKAPSRVVRYREMCYLPLPPKPVLTRWGTWLEAAKFYTRNFDTVKKVLFYIIFDFNI